MMHQPPPHTARRALTTLCLVALTAPLGSVVVTAGPITTSLISRLSFTGSHRYLAEPPRRLAAWPVRPETATPAPTTAADAAAAMPTVITGAAEGNQAASTGQTGAAAAAPTSIQETDRTDRVAVAPAEPPTQGEQSEQVTALARVSETSAGIAATATGAPKTDGRPVADSAPAAQPDAIAASPAEVVPHPITTASLQDTSKTDDVTAEPAAAPVSLPGIAPGTSATSLRDRRRAAARRSSTQRSQAKAPQHQARRIVALAKASRPAYVGARGKSVTASEQAQRAAATSTGVVPRWTQDVFSLNAPVASQ